MSGMRRDSLPDPSPAGIRPIIELRVPGPWETPVEFSQALRSAGCAYDVDAPQLVHIPTGRRFDLGVSPHDDEIAEVFEGAGRLSEEEIERIHSHAVKVHLSCAGGTVEDARAIMDAATALVRAGGYGVFIDNSGNAHSTDDWMALASDPKPGGLYWAFVAATGGAGGVFSTGMHCLGFRDAEILCIPDTQYAGFILHNFLGYTYQSGITVEDGDPIGDEEGPEFRVRHIPCTRFDEGTPFHNPYGVWRIERIEEDDDDSARNERA